MTSRYVSPRPIACLSHLTVGSLSIPLAKLGAKVSSSDISEAMTTEAAERAKVGDRGFIGYINLESRFTNEINPLCETRFWVCIGFSIENQTRFQMG